MFALETAHTQPVIAYRVHMQHSSLARLRTGQTAEIAISIPTPAAAPWPRRAPHVTRHLDPTRRPPGKHFRPLPILSPFPLHSRKNVHTLSRNSRHFPALDGQHRNLPVVAPNPLHQPRVALVCRQIPLNVTLHMLHSQRSRQDVVSEQSEDRAFCTSLSVRNV